MDEPTDRQCDSRSMIWKRGELQSDRVSDRHLFDFPPVAFSNHCLPGQSGCSHQSLIIAREGFILPLPLLDVELLIHPQGWIIDARISTKTREVLENQSPPPSRFPSGFLLDVRDGFSNISLILVEHRYNRCLSGKSR